MSTKCLLPLRNRPLGCDPRYVAAGSYYSRRSARDPDWRDAQIAAALERERRRREEDPDGLRAAAREKSARYRERIRNDPQRLADVRAKRAAAERERRANLSDDERKQASRAAVERKRRRRTPARRGLTFEELRERIPDFGGRERSSLRTVLVDEVRRGRVFQVGDRFVLNGKLPDDVRGALLGLSLADDRR